MHPLAMAAMTDPTAKFKHPHAASNPNGYKSYVCHAAVLHWCLIALHKTDEQAEELLAALMRKRQEGHNVMLLEPWDCYGPVFATKASFRPLPDDMLMEHCSVGDVVLIGNPSAPAHSMVVVSKEYNRVWVRGYNNFGTFAEAALKGHLPIPGANQYDSVNRSLSTRGVSQGVVPMYRTSGNLMMTAVKNGLEQQLGRSI